MTTSFVSDFVHALSFDDLPQSAISAAKRSTLDTLGVAIAGQQTPNARIVCNHAAAHHGAGDIGARLLFDGRRVSVPGAAMANAAMIDSFDAHDGHKITKGHAGVVVVPAALAFADGVAPSTGPEFLTRVVLGYEIAIRAGIALHKLAADYHTSGAWNALGAAAIGARSLGLDHGQTGHALGTAEYYGPRSPMMRAIDHPTMVKDGATYGAQAGVAAAFLAADGFTGGPAALIDDRAIRHLWSDLGRRWRVEEQYFKPYPVCRWAQPAIEAIRQLMARMDEQPVRKIAIHTFREATKLAASDPQTTEDAQYSLPFPVAAMLVDGHITADTVIDLPAPRRIVDVARRIQLVEDGKANEAFPATRLARAEVTLQDGSFLESKWVEPPGDPENPLPDGALELKFRSYAEPVMGGRATNTVVDMLWSLDKVAELRGLTDVLYRRVQK
ncbi:MAG: MmgE/PrpD family protein [Pseudomonadota bacterium]